MTLPDGTTVPQVKQYKHLGSEVTDSWENAQAAVRQKVIQRTTSIMRLIGKIGAMSGEHMRLALALAVEGVMGYYARGTVIRLEDCEKIEAVRAEVLKRRGFAAGEARIGIHARVAAGGQGYRHAYQHAVAALTAQFDENLHAQEGSPELEATRAHIRNEYVKLGWTGRGEMLEWHPEWAEEQLSEESTVQAWLLGRIRAGIRIKVGNGKKQEANKGEQRQTEEADGRGPAI